MTRDLGFDDPSLVREPMTVTEDGGRGSVLALLGRMEKSAFQGRKLAEAFAAWKRMIEGDSLICMGYAASMSSAGMWPLVTWLVERGYVDVLASTSANITEDLLDQMDETRVYRVDPEHVDDVALADKGYYRFYDHIVSSIWSSRSSVMLAEVDASTSTYPRSTSHVTSGHMPALDIDAA